MKKSIRLFRLLLLPFLLGGCSAMDKKSSENLDFNVDKNYVYGMTDLSYQEGEVDYTYTHKLFKNLGVKSVRIWMHCNWLMKSPTEYSTSGREKLTAIYNNLKNEGYQIIAMNHSNFHKNGQINSAKTTAKPARDLSEGSEYRSWLNDLETTYFNMVSAFPDIEYWEIDNECNNDDFMPRLGGGVFSLDEKAEIYYDMMYYASKGIHRANPNAQTVMGGLVVWNAEAFLTKIYDLIYSDESWSKNPDDYFQVACWHPYMEKFTKNKFITLNNDIYQIVKDREGKDKKVFLTEMGFSEGNGYPIDKQCNYIKDIYNACRDDLYYVESMHYFRMYDEYASTWGSAAEKTFGLFYDPTEKKQLDDGTYKELAEPKASAYAYQEVSGGQGSLTIYEDFLSGNFDTKIVMHRGYSNKARENTVASFTLAGQEENVYGIESDVYLTKDNKPIMIHDNNTSRVSYGKYNLDVKNSTFDELRNIRLPDIEGNPDVHQIPSLEEYCEVLKDYKKVGFLELKEDFNQEQLSFLINEIKKTVPMDQIVFISFYKQTLELLRTILPNQEIMLLFNSFNDALNNIESIKNNNFGIDIEYNGLNEENVLYCQTNNIKLNVWTIDNIQVAHKFGRLGVDYLTTNSIKSFKD